MALKQLLSIVAAMTIAFTTHQASADTFVDANDTVTYRQHAFSMIRDNFGMMAGMVRGEIKYDAAIFQQHANAVQHLANVPLAGFTGVGKGVTTNSDALPAIWNNWSDFESKMDDLIAASAELAVAAESGVIRTIAPKFLATAGTCKQCHDNYRAD